MLWATSLPRAVERQPKANLRHPLTANRSYARDPSLPELSFENPRDETSRRRTGDELLQAFLVLSEGPVLFRRLHRARVRRPNIGACDLVAVSLNQPVQSEQPGADCKSWLHRSEIACGASKRLRIAGGAAREGERLVVKPGFLGSGEPLALVSRSRLHQVGKDFAGGFVRIFLGYCPEGRKVSAAAACDEAIALVRLFNQAGREKDFLADRVDRGIVCPRAAARLSIPDRLGLLSHRRERLHGPALVGPESLDLQ